MRPFRNFDANNSASMVCDGAQSAESQMARFVQLAQRHDFVQDTYILSAGRSHEPVEPLTLFKKFVSQYSIDAHFGIDADNRASNLDIFEVALIEGVYTTIDCVEVGMDLLESASF